MESFLVNRRYIRAIVLFILWPLFAGYFARGLLGDDEWMKRVKLHGYSLGPAPYPHSVNSPYELFGSCYFRGDHVELTKAEPHQKGGLWSKSKLSTRNWQADFVFGVGGQTGHLFGDGFALWYTTERGKAGDALGGASRFSGAGIFFDTYANPLFRKKRHPYVYAMINDGTVSYSDMTLDDLTDGCHVPFRKGDAGIDLTEARLTYKDNILSVILRPKGSIEWVQCFQAMNVILPDSGYIGVTAMTGQVFDKHQMFEISVYEYADKQPFSYAVKNDISEVGEMWAALKHSGSAAVEIAPWELDIQAETEFDPIRRAEIISDALDDEDFVLDKLDHDTLDELYPEGTRIADILTEALSENLKKLKLMKEHMDAVIRSTSDRLTALVRDIREVEYRLNGRASKVAMKLNVEILRPAETEQKKSAHPWVLPFMLFMCIVFVVGIFGYTRYRKVMKTHLL